MRRAVAPELRLQPRLVELLERPHAFVRDAPDLLERSLKSRELVLQVFQRRSEPVAHRAAAIGKEEIAGKAADHCPDQRSRRDCRSFVHTTSCTGPELAFQIRCHDCGGMAGDFYGVSITGCRLLNGWKQITTYYFHSKALSLLVNWAAVVLPPRAAARADP